MKDLAEDVDGLDLVDGVFQELRIALKQRGGMEIPHPNMGFWDQRKNEIVESMRWQTVQKIADALLKRAA